MTSATEFGARGVNARWRASESTYSLLCAAIPVLIISIAQCSAAATNLIHVTTTVQGDSRFRERLPLLESAHKRTQKPSSYCRYPLGGIWVILAYLETV
jgi:hypothetical protein